jgi:prepilin-type N-terminal cleavage/methylation domain-containing protein
MNTQKTNGLTVVEVIVAISIIGILLAILTPSIIQSMRQTSTTGNRTQAAQIVNYLGRRLINLDTTILPATGQTNQWDYGQLGAAITDLDNDSAEGVSQPNNFEATISDLGIFTWQGVNTRKYQISVCFRNAGNENCITTTTLATPNPSQNNNSSASMEIN